MGMWWVENEHGIEFRDIENMENSKIKKTPFQIIKHGNRNYVLNRPIRKMHC